MKQIKDMSDEELKECLDDLRLTRKVGYDKTAKTRSRKDPIPEYLKGVDDNLAAVVLAELAKRGNK